MRGVRKRQKEAAEKRGKIAANEKLESIAKLTSDKSSKAEQK